MLPRTIDDLLHRPVSQIMTADPVAVHPSQKLSVVHQGMRTIHSHHVPVVDNDRFIGIITPMDFLAVTPAHATGGDSESFDHALDRATVREAMQEDVMTVSPQDTVEQACRHFTGGGYHCLPVVGERGELVGMLTTTDILRALLGG